MMDFSKRDFLNKKDIFRLGELWSFCFFQFKNGEIYLFISFGKVVYII